MWEAVGSLQFAVANKRHSRSEILDAAVAVATEEGLNQLSFGRIANRLAIPDRTVVYYFPTKEQLVGEVLGALSNELLAVLDAAFGSDPLPPDDLLRRAWPALTTPQADRVFAIFFEFIGLASARVEPYASSAPLLLNGWASWLGPRVATTSPDKEGEVLGLLAKLDGLLLLRRIGGAEAAEQAAKSLGVNP